MYLNLNYPLVHGINTRFDEEYKREVGIFALALNRGQRVEYPPFPLNYFDKHMA